MSSPIQDLRVAARSLLRHPGFTAAVVLSLALGIGANTAIFSLVDGTLRKPLPVPDPDSLVALYSTRAGSSDPSSFSYPDYLDYRRELGGVFSHLYGHNGIPLSLAGSDSAEMVWGERVTANYFTGLGLRPAIGRFFTPDDLAAEPDRRLAVLTFDTWQRRFGGDRSVVGSVVRLNGESWDVVGVAPEGFSGLQFLAFAPDFWLPNTAFAAADPGSAGMLEARSWRSLRLYGRLAPGVGIAEAEAAANAVAETLLETYPDQVPAGTRVHAIPAPTKVEPFFYQSAGGAIELAAVALLAAVGLVLLVACANVANLLLARAARNRREMAVRAALGSGRWRLVRQVLSEGVLLALAGGAAGLVLGTWLRDLFLLAAPELEFAVDYGVGLDGRVLTFTAVLSLATVLVFALVPAWRITRPNLIAAFHGDRPDRLGSGRLLGARGWFVVGQVALSLLLLVVAGLFFRSLGEVQRTDPGFAVDDLLLLSLNPEVIGYDDAEGIALASTIQERFGAVPGVEAVTLAAPLPLDTYSNQLRVMPSGFELGADDSLPTVSYSSIAPDYFETVGTGLIGGRGFTRADAPDAARVAVVNQTFAERFWPGESAIGEGFRLAPDAPWITIVGIAADGKYQTLSESPRPYVFLPLAQRFRSKLRVVVRSHGDPLALAPRLRNELRRIDPDLPAFSARTMEVHLERSLAGHQALASIAALFALLAAVLAALGVFGVMSYLVSQRRREIGIRMALGAARRDVMGLVVRRGLVQTGLGVAIGLALALAVGRLLGGLLVGVSGHDPVTLAVVPLAMGSLALVAAALPARRASRQDPLTVLRHH